MSLEHTDTETWSRPLLPAALEARVVGWMLRVFGLGLVVSAALGWIMLLTWQVAGPSRGGAPMRASTTVLGTPGGMVVDGMLNGLGVVCILCLLLPLLWGAEIAISERLAHGRQKAMQLVPAVLLLAGGAAALPVPAAWPMTQGLGGLIGTVVLALVNSAAVAIDPRHSVWMAGSVMLALGAALSTQVLIMSIRDLLPHGDRPRPTPAGSIGHRDVDFARPPRNTPSHDIRAVEPTFDDRAFEISAVPMAQTEGRASAYGQSGLDNDQLAVRGPAPDATPVADHSTQSRGGPPGWRDGVDDDAADFTEIADDPGDVAAGRDLARRLVRLPPGPRGSIGIAGLSVTTAVSALGGAIARGRAVPVYKRPSINLLRRSPPARFGDDLSQTVLRGTARLLLDVLEGYGVRGAIRAMRSGPVVTMFEFEPAVGVKAERVAALSEDIARAMNSPSARISATTGRSMLAIELPNPRREQITVRDIIETDLYRRPGLVLPLAIGRSVTGDPVVLDLAHLPHILIAGSTAARPTMALHAMLLSIVYRHGPESCRLLLIDPRLTDLSAHMGLPHLAMPIVSDPVRGVASLAWAVQQMEERAKQMATIGARSLDVFNNRVRNARKLGERAGRTVQTGFEPATGRAIFERETTDAEPLAHLIIVISELAELMAVDARSVEQALLRLAVGGPEVGIHIVAATDHPKEDTLTELVRQALPARLCLKLLSKHDSRTVLGEAGAEQLLSDGDMLVHDSVGGIVRMHAAIASVEDIEAVAAVLQAAGGVDLADDYPDIIANAEAGGLGSLQPAARGSADELYETAVALVVRSRSPSAAMLQKRLRIDPHHARALIERMRRDGLVFDEA